jgi:hypothetical protein
MRLVRQGGEQVEWSEDRQVEIGGVAYSHPHLHPYLGVWLERGRGRNRHDGDGRGLGGRARRRCGEVIYATMAVDYVLSMVIT